MGFLVILNGVRPLVLGMELARGVGLRFSALLVLCFVNGGGMVTEYGVMNMRILNKGVWSLWRLTQSPNSISNIILIRLIVLQCPC